MKRNSAGGAWAIALVLVCAQSMAAQPAYADACGDLRNSIGQLNQQIAAMGSAGASGGGSSGQAGALRDARDNYQNAYRAQCEGGGSSSVGSGGDAVGSMIFLGATILSNMMSRNHEQESQAEAEAQAEREQQEQAERQRAEAVRLAAVEQAKREADARQRQATSDPFAPKTSGNPFLQPAVKSSSAGILVAPNETAVSDALSRPVMEDLSARGVKGCPAGPALSNYCSVKPPWWMREAPGQAYTPAACEKYVAAATVDTPQCTLKYKTTLASSQAKVRNLARDAAQKQKCEANPFAEGCAN